MSLLPQVAKGTDCQWSSRIGQTESETRTLLLLLAGFKTTRPPRAMGIPIGNLVISGYWVFLIILAATGRRHPTRQVPWLRPDFMKWEKKKVYVLSVVSRPAISSKLFHILQYCTWTSPSSLMPAPSGHRPQQCLPSLFAAAVTPPSAPGRWLAGL